MARRCVAVPFSNFSLPNRRYPDKIRSRQAADRWAIIYGDFSKGKTMKQSTQQTETALLVIDIQKGLFEKSTPIYKAELLLKNINTLINKARQEGIPVFFIQHSSSKTLEKG